MLFFIKRKNTRTPKQIVVDHTNIRSDPRIDSEILCPAVAYATTALTKQSSRASSKVSYKSFIALNDIHLRINTKVNDTAQTHTHIQTYASKIVVEYINKLAEPRNFVCVSFQ